MSITAPPPLLGLLCFDTALGRCALVWSSEGIVGSQLPEENARATRDRMRQRFPTAQEKLMPPPFVQQAVQGIQRLLADRSLRERLSRNGLETAANWPDWTSSSAKFLGVLKTIAGSGERRATRDQLRGMSQQLQIAFETADHFQRKLIELGVEPKAMNPSPRYPFPAGRTIAELEADIRNLKAQVEQLRTEGGSSRTLELEAQIKQLQNAGAAQERVVLDRWDIMQEMGRTIFERDQRIAELEARLSQLGGD